jgi:hypothetical protein
MRFYVASRLGRKQSLTPEGFLLCEDVPLARTGEMIYGPNETPVQPGPDGLTHIFRDDAEVFRPETIASANGKPVVDNHPTGDVTPENWRALSCGHALNPRRGSGDDSDILLGDLLITCPNMIKDVRENGKREISLGYDAEYDELEPGKGRQRDIVINHIALVDKGRCGPRCSIGDQQKETEEMKTRDERTVGAKVWDAIRSAFDSKDKGALEKAIKDATHDGAEIEGPGHTHVHVEMPGRAADDDDFDDLKKKHEELSEAHDALTARVEALEGNKTADAAKAAKDAGEEAEAKAKKEKEDKEEAEKSADCMAAETGGTRDAMMAAKDSASLADSFQNTIALAEILSPGIKVPTFDAKAAPKATYDSICGLRRSTLSAAYAVADTRSMIDEIHGGKPLDLSKMTCDAVRTLFLGSAALKKRANNTSKTSDTTTTTGGAKQVGPVTSLADLNARNKEFYKRK